MIRRKIYYKNGVSIISKPGEIKKRKRIKTNAESEEDIKTCLNCTNTKCTGYCDKFKKP